MTDRQLPIIIIGGGHNGLVCAAYLAKAGQAVTVLEAGEQPGGTAITREFSPGFRVSAAAHLLLMLDRHVRSDLALDSAGLSFAHKDMASVALDGDGDHLLISADGVRGRQISDRDQVAFGEYHRLMQRFARLLNRLNNRVPPRVGTRSRADLLGLTKMAMNIRLLGKKDMREFLRMAGINIYDVLQEYFENPLLKGALCMDGVLGAHLGPRSNNSVFCALHRMSGLQGMSIPRGGMGALSDSLANVARNLGATIRCSAKVAKIQVEGDRVCGVELQDGEQINASTVVSSADVKSTFLDLLGARYLEAGFARKVLNIRQRGNTAKLHLALDGPPRFTGLDQQQLGERLLIAPDLDYVERAFNHAKYGEYSIEPVMEITLPSIHDHSLAPEGKHVLSAIVQYAPYDLKKGWSDGKAAFTKQVIDLLTRYAPGIEEQILHTELLTPADLEKEFLVGGGHWHHAELSLDQYLMLRPVPGSAQYTTPVNGLFLCGAGSHPGGGVMGSAGRNAARVILATTGREGNGS